MKQIELIGKRKPREKHFLRNDGSIVAYIYSDDVHFLENGKYVEIDNSLIKDKNKYYNKTNNYKVVFEDNNNKIMSYQKDNHYFDCYLDDERKNTLQKSIKETKHKQTINYKIINKNIDINYQLIPNGLKEEILLYDEKSVIPSINFVIKTDLELVTEDDGCILANYGNKRIFKIEKPFMRDSNNRISNNIKYLVEYKDNEYLMKLILDIEWLKKAKFPVTIDPTINNNSYNGSVYSTYICDSYPTQNYCSSNELRAGVDENGNVYRSLLKFELPELSTGDQVINAQLDLAGFPFYGVSYLYDSDLITVHEINDSWQENTANWQSMYNKYDTCAEACFEGRRTIDLFDGTAPIDPTISSVDITNIVKKWYSNTDNNGIMLKSYNEVYNGNFVPSFCSKNYSTEVKPLLSITYRNNKGLEDYIKYLYHDFVYGNSNINLYNGNLVTVFELGKLLSTHFDTLLNITYNASDSVDNADYGYGRGWKLDYYQTLEYDSQNDIFVYNDENGTIHYFNSSKDIMLEDEESIELNGGEVIQHIEEDGFYYDEDYLNLKVSVLDTTHYIMHDKYNNYKIFELCNGIGRLSYIKNVDGHEISITYSNNRISKISSNDFEVNLNYQTNSIVLTCADKQVTLNYNNNNLLTSIVSSLGTIQINYNNNNLISEIIDVDALKEKYEYYNQYPYRVKKNIEYGRNNTLGDTINIIYDFSTTTITNSEDKAVTYTFNEKGNIESVTSYNEHAALDNAIGFSMEYGDYQKNNRILNQSFPQKYNYNYISDSSFENNSIHFTNDLGVETTICSTCSHSGNKSLMVTNDHAGCGIHKTINVPRGDYYTFSAYFKNDFDFILSLDYEGNCLNSNNIISSRRIKYNQDFTRYDVSIYFAEDGVNTSGQLEINITFDNAGDILYIDDMQLESGNSCGPYNLLDNSNFVDGFNGWHRVGIYDNNGIEIPNNDNYDIIQLLDGTKACKIILEPDVPTGIKKLIRINGKTGDIYRISFWYKNEAPNDDISFNFNSVLVNYYAREVELNPLTNEEEEVYNAYCAIPSHPLNHNNTEWQFFSDTFIAQNDFEEVELSIFQEFKINNLYITNVCLYKDEINYKNDFDENGNITYQNGVDGTSNSFDYDNSNELIKISSSSGNCAFFEYDNQITNRKINNITSTGVASSIKYNANGKPVMTTIKNIGELGNGKYKIRAKGTQNYLYYTNTGISLSSDNHNHNSWSIVPEEDYYKIRNVINENLYLCNDNDMLHLKTYLGEKNKFYFIQNKNGSYLIKSKFNNKYLKVSATGLVFDELDDGNYEFEFYIEKNNKLFIENDAVYTVDNTKIRETTDSLLHKKEYQFNSNDLPLNIVESSGLETEYTYNSKNKLIMQQADIKQINYEYNNYGLLTKVSDGNNDYNFIYDNFNRIVDFKINNNVIVSKNYTTSGNIESIEYANGDDILFDYDDFGRINKIEKIDNTYNYIYDCDSNIQKIISDENNESFYYDIYKRLRYYDLNSYYNSKYDYASNNLVESSYSLPNIYENVQNTYGLNNEIVSSNFDQDYVSYSYDELGRITQKNINNLILTSVDYIHNGNRTSFIPKSIRNAFVNNYYKYDKSNNITHIYKSGSLSNKYYYDRHNQLVREDDYDNLKTIRYKYDSYGNILSKKVFELNTYNLLEKNVYEYNNISWKDQLTNYNGESITYDAIGNPVLIGSKSLSWTNGRELMSFQNGNNIYSYKYNNNGERIQKDVNGLITNYYLENGKIIFEENDDYTLYFMYSGTNELIGFKYYTMDQFFTMTSSNYYYLKNMQNDIIGIIDASGNVVCHYEYDSLGNILRITDANGILINDSNHIANINPFRYREYYYDKETNYYYLKSRYYNPIWGRFINPDCILVISDLNTPTPNLYMYSGNSFINYIDNNGKLLFGLLQYIVYKGLENSIKGLLHFLGGSGESLHFDDDSSLANKLRKSSIMKNEMNNAVKEYETSQKKSGKKIDVYLDDNPDLLLFVRGAKYDYSIQKETRVVAFNPMFSIRNKYQYRYAITINLYDRYDFNTIEEVHGISNILNNLGYVLQSNDIGEEYNWSVDYVYHTNWVDSNIW